MRLIRGASSQIKAAHVPTMMNMLVLRNSTWGPSINPPPQRNTLFPFQFRYRAPDKAVVLFSELMEPSSSDPSPLSPRYSICFVILQAREFFLTRSSFVSMSVRLVRQFSSHVTKFMHSFDSASMRLSDIIDSYSPTPKYILKHLPHQTAHSLNHLKAYPGHLKMAVTPIMRINILLHPTSLPAMN